MVDLVSRVQGKDGTSLPLGLSIALLCLLVVPVRFYHFTAPPIDEQSYRQTWTASIVRNYVERDRNFLHPQIDILGDNRWAYIEFPLYEYLLALPMMALGYSEGLIRAFNIACGLLTVLVLFRFLREEGLNTGAAAAAAACYAATPVAIFFNRALMMDTFVVMLGALYLLCLQRWIERGHTRELVIAIAIISVAALQKLPTAWPALTFGFCLMYLRKGWTGLTSSRFLLSMVAAALPLLAWVALVRLAGYGMLSKSSTSGWLGWHVLLDWERMRDFFLRMINGFSVFWGLLAATGAWLEFRGRRWNLLLLGACGVSAFVVFPELNIVHAHYQLPILFAVAPLAGVGLAGLVDAAANAARRPRWSHALLVLCLAGVGGCGFQAAVRSHFPTDRHLLEAARELQTIPEKNPQLYYVWGSAYPGLHYLARRRGLIIPDGSYPHSALYKDYKELLVYAPGDQHPPAAIAHGLKPFRLARQYHYWQLYVRDAGSSSDGAN